MSSTLLARIETCSAHLENRTALKDFALSHPDYIDLIFKIAMDSQNSNQHKACWALELILAEQPHLLQKHILEFCQCLRRIDHESAKRPMAKIAYLLVSSSEFTLDKTLHNILIKCCFDWLLTDTKIATQCYALDILSELTSHYPQLLEDIRPIIDQRYSTSKPSFQRRAEKFARRHFNVSQKKQQSRS